MAPSVAQTLPVDILLLICRLATDDHPTLFAHGGKLPGARWDSNECAHPLTLVCKKWHSPASAVLYQSLAVAGGDQARLLLRTLGARPALAANVKRLVIGLGDPDDDAQVDRHSSDQDLDSSHESRRGLPQSEASAREDSFALVDVLGRCANLTHLQIRRALHHDTREVALPFLGGRDYETLICAPRFVEGEACVWTERFHQPEDVLDFVRPCMRFFEFEFSFPSLDYTSQEDGVRRAATDSDRLSRLMNLRGLRLDGNVPPAALEQILTRAISLETLDVYTESDIDVNQVFDRVFHSGAGAIKRLSGTPPTSFLSCLTQLDSAVLSSTELACATFLRAIPPSLRSLEILCFAHDLPFYPAILAGLRDRRLELGLAQWKILDAREAWTAEQVRDVGEACEARGIQFTWEPGLAESDSSGFGSGSGSGSGSSLGFDSRLNA